MIATIILIKCIFFNAENQSAYALVYHVRTLETKFHAGDNHCLPPPLNLRHPFCNAGAMHIVTRTASWIPSSFVRHTPQLRFAVCECSSTLLTQYPCLLSFRWPGDEKNKGSLYECFIERKILEKISRKLTWKYLAENNFISVSRFLFFKWKSAYCEIYVSMIFSTFILIKLGRSFIRYFLRHRKKKNIRIIFIYRTETSQHGKENRVWWWVTSRSPSAPWAV